MTAFIYDHGPDQLSATLSQARSQDIIRVLVEDGNVDIERYYEPGVRFGCSKSLLHRWHGSDDDYIWLASEKRLILLGDELQEFYFSLAVESSIYQGSGVISFLQSKLEDLPKLAQTKVHLDAGVLHNYLRNWEPFDHFKRPGFLFDAVGRIIDAGADIHALDDYHRTPLMAFAGISLGFISWANIHGHPGDTSMDNSQAVKLVEIRLSQYLKQWLAVLETRQIKLDDYIQEEESLGASQWMELRAEGELYVFRAESHSWFVRILFDHNACGTTSTIRFQYQFEERPLKVPGAWDEEETARIGCCDGSLQEIQISIS